MKNKLLIVRAGIFFVFIIVAVLLSQNIDTAAELKDAVLAMGALGWVAFVSLYTIGTVFLFPGTIFTVTGGLLYGLWLGFLLNMVGAMAGASAAYYASRVLGKKAFDGLAPTRLRELEQKVSKRPFETVLLLRLIPLIPYNALNFALGITSIRFKSYFWGTFWGILPGSFVYTYAAVRVGEVVVDTGLQSLTRQDLIPLIPAFLLVLALAIVPFVVRRFQHNKLNKDESVR